uniref:Lon proteolytic domain-containing protein n=1 Tax=Globodera pallida TaxID=36090 RepID=A0A183CED4_GLOPA
MMRSCSSCSSVTLLDVRRRSRNFLSLAHHQRLPEGMALTGGLAADGAVLGVTNVLQKVTGAQHAGKTIIVLPLENEGAMDPVLFGDQFPGMAFHYVDTLQQFCAQFFPQ